jgi:monofunctional glycosyltransferase
MLDFFKRRLRRWYWSIPRDESGKMRWGLYFRRLIIRLALWFLGISIGSTILYSFVPVPCTPLMFSRLFEQMGDPNRDMRWKRDWVPIEQISPHMQLAIICQEDGEFLEHEGFDFNAIRKAYKYNKTHKKKRGASTISQQTAKNVFLWETRSWFRKGLEVYFTFLIETIWSKERIIEVYLNVIEFGDGVYGVEAAAQTYYGKSASALTRTEAVALASVVPSPLKRSVLAPDATMRALQSRVRRDMRAWGGEIDYEDPNTPKQIK